MSEIERAPDSVPPWRALVADDVEDARLLTSVLLRQAGVSPVSAEDGVQALAVAEREGPFDLIVLDMQMPELDGYATAMNLRRDGYAGPILALTADDDAATRRRCLDAGCSDYLPKPLEVEAFRTTLGRLLGTPGLSSSLAPRPGLEPLQRRFRASLPTDCAALRETAAAGERQDLARRLHSLKGLAALYGYAPIGRAAARAQALARGTAPWPELEAALDELIVLCGRVSSGC